MNKYKPVTNVNDLKDNVRYKLADLQAILKALGENYSIYTIRDYETWKCLDYKCGYRHNTKVSTCERCKGPVRPPLIESPRTRGGGKGPGHRRYTAKQIKGIVKIFRDGK